MKNIQCACGREVSRDVQKACGMPVERIVGDERDLSSGYGTEECVGTVDLRYKRCRCTFLQRRNGRRRRGEGDERRKQEKEECGYVVYHVDM